RITGPEQLVGVGGDGIITFGSGQPDLPPPEEVFRVELTLDDLKYGPIQGEPDLREVLAKQYSDASSESFVVTNGASESLDLALRALYKPGAKVLLPKPYYYSYPRNVHYAHMEAIYYKLVEGKIDYQDFEDKIQNARVVIINSPSNPTGTVQDLDTLERIEKLASRLGVYIISDEVYKDLIYVRENYLIKGDHVLTINSFSKTYNMCGARVGYIYAREQWLIEKMTEIKTHASMNTPRYGQRLALAVTRCPVWKLLES
ncbi:pyridoxal phosphate-dependent aminotransferase, partial [Patescibacteria group bacterium]